MSHEQDAVKEILKGIKYMLDKFYSNTTKIYDGIIISSEAKSNGKWDVQFNGEVHSLKPYGSVVPSKNLIVKVQIPQGNMSLAYFI